MLAVEPCQAEVDFGATELKALFHDLAGKPALAVAVSGGSDSTALLHLVHDWHGLTENGPRLVALTVDHSLRADSAAEAQSVATDCARLGIEHHTLLWEGTKPTTGVQAKARTARYDLMTAWCKSKDIDVLLTAHTADDQAETVLMRARRTKSAESLAGIWPERPWNGVCLKRPLLQRRRNALRLYLTAKSVGWSEDPSNENANFERVRIRRALASGKVPELVSRAEQAQAETLARQALVRGFLARHGTIGQASDIRLQATATAGLGEDERLALCRAMVLALRGQVTAERAELLRLAQWLGGAVPGRRTLNGLVFQKRRNDIVIGREPGRIPPIWQDVTGQTIWDQRFAIVAPSGAMVGPARLAPEIARVPEVPLWLQFGLPVVELATSQRILAYPSPGSNELEQLGIAVRPTYVNGLEGVRMA